MQFRLSALLGPVLFVLTACGGGGGSGDGIKLVRPSISATGIPATESLSVTLSTSGETLVFAADGSQTFTSKVQDGGSYTLRISSQPASTNCAFSNGNSSISGTSVSSTKFSISCGGGSTGGGGGPVSTLSGPFKVYGWNFHKPDSATMAFPISLRDGSENPVTGAALSNFTFYEDSQEVVNSQEFPIAVMPMPSNNASVNLTLVVDVSQSLTASDISSLKTGLKNHINNLPATTSISIWAFDSTVVQLTGYTTDKNTLSTAIDSIPTDPDGRDSSTDLYGAITDASASNLYGLYSGGSLGYVVVITDGVHTSNSDSPSTTSAEVEDRLVYAVGIGDGYDPAALSTAIGLAEGAGQTLIPVAGAGDVGNALDQIYSRVETFIGGLHAIYYRSPRRSSGEYRFSGEATPLDDCAAISVEGDACLFYWDYDSATVQASNSLVIMPSAVNALPSQTITFRIPQWDFCSPTPSFQWNLSVSQGSATSTVIDGGQALEVNTGTGSPVSFTVTATDTVSGCSASVTLP